MKPIALVVTTVHWPDDTRIRERLIRTLQDDFDVVYACREPGPADRSGITVRVLSGGRLKRNLRSVAVTLRSPFDVMVIHDPELIPLGVLARLVKRKPVVLDIHEDIPATALSRTWVPERLRRPLSRFLGWLLSRVDGLFDITLAEAGYQRLFRSERPVFANYPDTSRYPDPRPMGNGEAVYLGDVTRSRGVDVAMDACRTVGVPLTVIGRVAPDMETELEDARSMGVLPNPNAVETVADYSVGLAPLRDEPNYRQSQPTKVLEYLALGIPVVASDLPGTRALVDGQEAVYLVPPDDAEALAESVRCAVDPEVRTAAVRQAPEIRQRYAWPKTAVRDYYLSLL